LNNITKFDKTNNGTWIIFLFNKIHAIMFDQGILMTEFLWKVKKVTTQLVQIKEHVLETKMLQIMFNALLESYKKFIQSTRG
jgi:hypothetical protein